VQGGKGKSQRGRRFPDRTLNVKKRHRTARTQVPGICGHRIEQITVGVDAGDAQGGNEQAEQGGWHQEVDGWVTASLDVPESKA